MSASITNNHPLCPSTYNVKGIGSEDARLIAYMNMTEELTSTFDYRDAREGSIQAAILIFGSNSQQLASTIAAWDAVGVYELPHDIEVCGDFYNVIVHKSINEISTCPTSTGLTAVVKNGADVEFVSGSAIRLRPGFYTEGGSKFNARIAPCAGLFQKRPIIAERGEKSIHLNRNSHSDMVRSFNAKQINAVADFDVEFNLQHPCEVELLVVDILGTQSLRVLEPQNRTIGRHTVTFSTPPCTLVFTT